MSGYADQIKAMKEHKKAKQKSGQDDLDMAIFNALNDNPYEEEKGVVKTVVKTAVNSVVKNDNGFDNDYNDRYNDDDNDDNGFDTGDDNAPS
jgi:hypothetical protein